MATKINDDQCFIVNWQDSNLKIMVVFLSIFISYFCKLLPTLFRNLQRWRKQYITLLTTRNDYPVWSERNSKFITDEGLI